MVADGEHGPNRSIKQLGEGGILALQFLGRRVLHGGHVDPLNVFLQKISAFRKSVELRFALQFFAEVGMALFKTVKRFLPGRRARPFRQFGE